MKPILRLLVLAPLCVAILSAQEVVRGPYLQIGTPTSVVVRWRTDLPTDSAVRFGTNPGTLDREVKTKWQTTEHIVALEGLMPSTRYFYAVGNAEKKILGDTTTHFVTSPKPGTRQPIRTWIVGDAGTASAKGNEGLQAQ